MADAIGASKDEIEKAVENAMKDAEKKCMCEDENRALETEEKKLAIDERRAGLKTAPAKEANVNNTEAATKKLTEEAKVAGKPPPNPAGAGGSSSK